jgi:hypothetical protein
LAPGRLIQHLSLACLFALTACGDLLDGPPPAPPPLVVLNGSQPPSEAASRTLRAASFARRCAAPEVVRCVSFDGADQIPDLTSSGRGPMGVMRSYPSGLVPELDCEVAVNGCSLRFTVPSRSGAGTSGSWYANFSDDFSVRFGEGSEFFVQWRQRFSRDFLATQFRGGGWKQAVVGEGDRPGYAPDGKVVWSCTQLELAVQNTWLRGYPQMYHSCGEKDGQYEELPGSRYVPYEPDEWMTFQMRVKIGTWYRNDRNYHGDSAVELWVAREGGRSTRAVVADGYDIANTKPGAEYGKLWLLPYHTDKDATQDHPVGYVWYDEVIISRAPIPDP